MDAALAVALFGNLVLFLSVILLGLQVRNGARATLASVYQAINDNMLQINRLFIDRPSLRAYFYGQQELTDESPEDRERIEATAELFINFTDKRAYPDAATTQQPCRAVAHLLRERHRKQSRASRVLEETPGDVLGRDASAHGSPDSPT